MLEEAIASYEKVLTTRIPERKFDFSLDFVVNNELARTLYQRSQLERVKSPERREWLKKAIAAYHRTLSIDSEDFDAHYVLGQAFGDPSWKSIKLEDPDCPAE